MLLSPAAASFDMFVDYAARGRAFKEAVERLAAERRAQQEEGADEPPRLPPVGPARPTVRSRDARPPHAGRTPPQRTTLKRERHQADYTILVVVVALIAIGILMVYSARRR